VETIADPHRIVQVKSRRVVEYPSPIVPIGTLKGTAPTIDLTATKIWAVIFEHESGLWTYDARPAVTDSGSPETLTAALADAIANAVVEEFGIGDL